MNFRKITLKTGTEAIFGKNAESNDKLMNNYRGKNNTIIHTLAPGSPFGVIEKIKPTKAEIYETGVYVAKYSQDWRDNKGDVKVSVFTGKDISKPIGAKPGLWYVKKSKTITINKKDIEKLGN